MITSELFSWQSPAELSAKVEQLGSILGETALGQRGQEFRDAFVASRFAATGGWQSVRLLRPGSNPTPDFAVKRANSERWYEVTEADRPNRKRTAEQRDLTADAWVQIPDEHWVDPDTYFQVIQNRAAKKANKNYQRCDGLILWSNAFPIANLDSMCFAWWQRALRPASNAFSEVWYHENSKFVRAF